MRSQVCASSRLLVVLLRSAGRPTWVAVRAKRIPNQRIHWSAGCSWTSRLRQCLHAHNADWSDLAQDLCCMLRSFSLLMVCGSVNKDKITSKVKLKIDDHDRLYLVLKPVLDAFYFESYLLAGTIISSWLSQLLETEQISDCGINKRERGLIMRVKRSIQWVHVLKKESEKDWRRGSVVEQAK